MIYNEEFFENNQPVNPLLYIRKAGIVKKDKSYNISRADSKTAVIGFLKDGKLHLEFDGKKTLLKSGTVIVIPAFSKYRIFSDIFEPCEFYWLNIRGSVFNSTESLTLGSGIKLINYDILPQIEEIKRLIASDKDKAAEIAGVITKLLFLLSSAGGKDTENEICDTFEKYLSDRLSEEFSTKKMAEFFGISTDTLIRRFKAKYSLTPYRYYQKMRIEIAKSLLCETDLSVEEITERLHFTDRNYFSLYFKKQTGFSPVRFRKEIYEKRSEV